MASMKLIMENWTKFVVLEQASGTSFTPEELAQLDKSFRNMLDAYEENLEEGILGKLGRGLATAGLAASLAMGGGSAKAAEPAPPTTSQVAKSESASPKVLLGALQHYINSRPDLKSKVNAEEATMDLQVKLAKMRDGKPTEGFTPAQQSFVDTLAKIVDNHPELVTHFTDLGMVQIDYVDVNPMRGAP